MKASRIYSVVVVLFVFLCMANGAYGKIMKGPTLEPINVRSEKDIDFLTESAEWTVDEEKSDALLSPWRDAKNARKGKYALRIHTRTNIADGKGGSHWAMGINGAKYNADKPMDWSEYGAISFYVKMRAKGSKRKLNHFRIYLHSGSVGYRMFIMVRATGKWERIIIPLKNFGGGYVIPNLKKITGIDFQMEEISETHGAEIDILLDEFKLLKTKPVPWTRRCKSGTALTALYVGAAEEMTILPAGTESIAAAVGVVTGRSCFITNEYKFRFVFHEVFSGKKTVYEIHSPGNVIPEAKALIPVALPIKGLKPGFYLAIVDVLKDGKSILNGRVGVDDFYIQKKGESIEYSLMSWMTAETYFAQHPKYGYVYKRVRGSLPHTWNPLDPKTYREFLLAHGRDAVFYIEDLHSSGMALPYAAEVFRHAGDVTRQKFTEGMLRRLIDFMTGPMMLNDEGAVICSGCPIADNDGDKLPHGTLGMKPTRINHCHESQTCDWFIIVGRAAMYFASLGNDVKYAKALCKKMDFAVPFTVEAFGEKIGNRIVPWNYHSLSTLKLKNRWRFIPKGPSGEPTQYCCGTRSLPGFAIYALARQSIMGSVPELAKKVLRDTAHWYGERVDKHNGWTDHESEKPFLEANMYTGEGYTAYYIYCKLIGDEKEAARVKKWGLLAYEFITDHSMAGAKCKDGKITGGKRVKLIWNNWGGSVMVWSFYEYLLHLGEEPKFRTYMDKILGLWKGRGYRDMLHRPWRHRRRDLFIDIPKCPYVGSGMNDIPPGKELAYSSPDKGAIYWSWMAAMAIRELQRVGHKSVLLGNPDKR